MTTSLEELNDEQLRTVGFMLNGTYGRPGDENTELKDQLYKEYLTERQFRSEDNRKYEGEFLGFRRIAGSYNQNWRWDESYI